MFLLPFHIALTAGIGMAGLIALSLGVHEPQSRHDVIAVVCGLIVIGLMVYMRFALKVRWLSAVMVYLVLLWMFHFGLVFTAALLPDVLATHEERAIEWLYWSNVRVAMILALLGAAGFVCGAGTMTLGRGASTQEAPVGVHDPALYVVGWLVMLVGLAGGAVALMRGGGLGVFEMSYREFRASVLAPTRLLDFIQIAQLGCLLALCGASALRWVAPVTLWIGFASILLLLGLRNEAMIPLVSFAIVLRHRGVQFNNALLLSAVLAALLVMPAIRAFRTVGFTNRASVDWTEVSPLATFVELGGTLRAAKAYVDWIDLGDPYLLGASYWAPLDRHLIVWVLPWREPLPYGQDPRIPARHMTEREGAVGGAASGEAFYNFGPIGPFVFFGCIGALLAWLERRARRAPYRCALLTVVMFPLFWNMRGQWISVPAQMVTGLLLVGACYSLSTIRRRSIAHDVRSSPRALPGAAAW